MDKAKNIEEFVKLVADGLSIGCTVRYDLKSLSYGEVHQYQLDEYGEYLDMAELSEDIEEELRDWEIDEVKYLREIFDLPDEIEPPRTWKQIDWMVDFANERSKGPRFVKEVQRAIDSRHPFGAFKDVIADYGLLEDWYQYRDECYRDYVRSEIDLDEL